MASITTSANFAEADSSGELHLPNVRSAMKPKTPSDRVVVAAFALHCFFSSFFSLLLVLLSVRLSHSSYLTSWIRDFSS